jgi:thioredoxin 1
MVETPDARHVANGDDLQQIIAHSQAVMVYFSTPDCSVCRALRPKLMQLTHERYALMQRVYVDIAAEPALGAAYNVFTVPTVLVFLEGREFARRSRAFSPAELLDALARPWEVLMEP